MINSKDHKKSRIMKRKFKNHLYSFVRRTFFCICLSTAFIFNIKAQKEINIDSLELILSMTNTDTTKLMLLNQIFHNECYNHKRALEIAESMLQIANTIQKEDWIIKSLSNKSSILSQKFDYISAINTLNQALVHCQNSNDEHSESIVLYNIGRNYYLMTDYDKALDHYQRSLSIADRITYTELMIHIYVQIAILHSKMKVYQASKDNLKEALKFMKEDRDSSSFYLINFNLSVVYYEEGQYDSAIFLMKKMLEYHNPKEKSNRGSAMLKGNMAFAYLRMQDYENANSFAQSALHENTELQNKDLLIENYLVLGEIHRAKKEYDDADKYYNDALTFSKGIGSLEQIKNTYYELAQLYQEQNKLKETLRHFQEYWYYNDSIFSLEKNTRFNQLREKHKIERKQIEIESLKKVQLSKNIELVEKQKAITWRNYLIITVILSFSIGTTLIIMFMKKRNQLNLTNKTLTNIKYQQNQLLGIVAHDLKNNLNDIYSIVEVLRRNGANLEEIQLNYLSAMQKNVKRLKVTINNILNLDKLKDKVSTIKKDKVDTELLLTEVLESHIFSAMEKQIKFSTHIDPCPLVLGDKHCLRVIFDNLISNAVKYCPKEGPIEIRLYNKNNRVYFSIHNEVKNILLKDLDQLFTKYNTIPNLPTGGEVSTGLGLSIVKEYINLMKGKVQVEIKDGGFRVTFSIPEYQAANNLVLEA